MEGTVKSSVRVDGRLLDGAGAVLGRLGLSTSTAVEAYLRQVARLGALPVVVRAEPDRADRRAISVRLDPQAHAAVSQALERIGTPMSDAVDAFLRDVVEAGGISFPLRDGPATARERDRAALLARVGGWRLER